ncbi:mechanosensitive ion channel family protein [Aquisalibacillus elongatus]|uniref:Small conductance mechanosensitive channel n=1 Tax=Aquisalibacillus elongatus TaxID=485577 RepID=A0A3N5C240_9BACI|nr:mechanosensitive ion channel family protein [Aquisalibacillus elongatus]RPF56158.1 small conductance mechanosensitive channel [Aquisalibacillus elongatus]
MDFDLNYIISISIDIGILLLVFIIVAPLGRKAISSIMDQVAKKQNLKEGRKKTLEKLLQNIFTYALLVFFTLTLLDMFISITPLLAGVGILGLAIGFGAQGLVTDIVTGFFILIEKQIDVDDYVTAGGENGIVEELGLRTTQIRGFDGTLHFVPNRNIQNVNNHTRGNMRALVDIGISYDENIDEVIDVLQKACDPFKDDERVKEGPDVVGVQSFGSSDVVLRIIAQTEKMEQFGVEREIRKACKEALDQAGIEIPYPHQVYIEKKENA